MSGLDLFCLTERHRAIARRASDLAGHFAERADAHDRAGTFPVENFDELYRSGHSLLTVPSRYGGEGGGVYEMVLAQAYLARGDGSTALAIGWHLHKIGQAVERQVWPEPILERICTGAVRDGRLVNAAASEPELGSPSRGGRPGTTARQVEGGWALNGKKNFTTLAPVLHYFVVLAAIEGSAETGWFLVEKGTPGLAVVENWDTLGMRATGSHDLLLQEVRLPAEALLERWGPGLPKQEVPGNAAGWDLHIPACYLGVAEAAREFALAFARRHRTTSTASPIADLPAVQAQIGQMELDLVTARHALFSVARRWDEDPAGRAALTPDCGAVKVLVVNSAIRAVDRAMRVVGAASLFREHPLERYYRDVRAGLHNPPMEDAALTRLARSALQLAEERHFHA
jgi:alkylation response protein AidB-like acyl-CoA dehydrogenase